MTQQDTSVEGFFDNIGGSGAVTAKLSDVGDGVIGTIESQRIVDYVPFGKKDPEVLDGGKIRKQLVVILQTDLRNWDGVKEAPYVDRDDPSKGRKPGSDDDGRRAIYVPQFKNIHYAVADAVRAATGKSGPLRDGARFGVKVDRLEDTGQGNPKKVHLAVYEPPAASEGFLGGGSSAANPGQQEQPVDQAAQEVPPTTQAETPAAAPQQTQQVDPWTGTASQPKTPPF